MIAYNVLDFSIFESIRDGYLSKIMLIFWIIGKKSIQCNMAIRNRSDNKNKNEARLRAKWHF